MKNGEFTMSLIGETSVGPSQMPAALEEHVRSMFGDRQMVVLDCVEHGVPAGLDGRLVGNPAGYAGYKPAEGLLATLELGRFETRRHPVVLLDVDFEPRSVN